MDTVSKRRTERIPVQLAVVWHRGLFCVDLVALDINLHGLFLRTTATVPAGSLLRLSIVLPDGHEPITLFVTARFVGMTVSGQGIGAEMHLMNPEDSARWEAFYRDTANEFQAPANQRTALSA